METNSTAKHITSIPAPSKKGTFSIMEDGALLGRPESSAVEMWVYLPQSQTLSIHYKGGKNYHYHNVPFTVVMQMLTADSFGKFVNVVVKKYEFTAIG